MVLHHMHDVLVIGGGVAGLQAAVFTAKAGLETVVLDDGNPLVSNTDKIQNLLTEERIAGDEIIKSGRERVMEFDGNIEKATVTRLDREDMPGPFTVTTESDDSYRSEAVIIATANEFDMLTPLDDEIEYVDGPEGEFTMEKHIQTDDANQASDNIYVAGLANTWEYQTAVAIGDGAKAAINLVSDRNEEAYIDHDW
ncbi:oxidoreductase (homolog to thioredoxin-disulfide reductase) [Haloquadratum walsbyi C23]|jgi:thioredoxin reductase|uniref:Oxidoreductase (Homolog to thioredoxin-disulfide reductase) n=3 Tax=Haloquadratum walsbyi TaxID=293091 RepID=Q18HH8_HALWD|nr:oxidoreductase (homolog to thioredoxin-disulfide reductase) [Haloquadratum walsbyi DSM 16790]CCC40564.1 oxidoreductase (homolog to thioredoxin-disulfide reductase) [Haloquadratum walsbyi C23]